MEAADREALLFYKAAEHKVIIKDTAMDYVEFGYGSRPLIILPGLGDGLRTVHGQAVNLAFYYRKIAPYYRVYIFSRKNKLEEGCTTKDMARICGWRWNSCVHGIRKKFTSWGYPRAV